MEEFYTRNGWKGSKCNTKLTIKEISKLIKKDLKELFKKEKYKISVTSSSNLYTQKISVKITTNSKDEILAKNIDEMDEEQARKLRIKLIENLNKSCKQEELNEILNEHLKKYNYYNLKYYELKNKTKAIVYAYNYDDSDSNLDYFDAKFYSDIEIIGA